MQQMESGADLPGKLLICADLDLFNPAFLQADQGSLSQPTIAKPERWPHSRCP
jgi:hypothetical protein